MEASGAGSGEVAHVCDTLKCAALSYFPPIYIYVNQKQNRLKNDKCEK
jgi:hypothetical protein